ncbi:putative metallophosphoesterase 1 [Cocos nucifera]|uniref:Putative metallophosphoesterase 1 n=1 Tax=Cocos nucifera TaxID=13894 RepID=A0A8K0ISE8_COCNU|nr:putative metallophosphoesterase 1 [Cocos nucifera]
MAAWRAALPLLLVAALVTVEDMISAPSCEISGHADGDSSHPDDLKVMMVADLLLQGSDAGFADVYFWDLFRSKFFKKSYERFKPDMLLVLGDISARGSELTKSKWSTVLQQFESMLGPFAGLPLHIVLGDRDVGTCNSNNALRVGVEKAIERESVDLRTQMKDATSEATVPDAERASFSFTSLRDNDMASGSGPVVLLHFPLHRKTRSNSGMIKVVEENLWHYTSEDLRSSEERDMDLGPYEFKHTLPLNATEYIFQALKPRIVFSAHAHSFCDHAHSDGTREVTIPAMTWAARGKPGFVVVTFGQNKAVTVNQCSLATQSQVAMAYMFIFILSIATILLLLSPGFYGCVNGTLEWKLQAMVHQVKVVEILVQGNMEELKLVHQTYLALYDRDLLHLLSQKDNPFAVVAYLRASKPPEREIETGRGALLGQSLDANILIEIICTCSSLDPSSVKQLYQAWCNSDLERAVSSKKGRVDMSMAMCEAKTLSEAIESGKMH